MPNGLDKSELELHRELWMWRGFAILLMLLIMVTTVIQFYTDGQRQAYDNKVRAEAWTKIELGVETNARSLAEVRRQLEHCTQCHTPIDPKAQKMLR